jgi:hypothetical protein
MLLDQIASHDETRVSLMPHTMANRARSVLREVTTRIEFCGGHMAEILMPQKTPHYTVGGTAPQRCCATEGAPQQKSRLRETRGNPGNS